MLNGWAASLFPKFPAPYCMAWGGLFGGLPDLVCEERFERVDIQLVPSGGMKLNRNSICLLPAKGNRQYSYAFNCDGLLNLRCTEYGSHVQLWNQAEECNLHLQSGVQRSYLRLSELEQRLDDSRFLRCNHSFIINMAHVDSIENGCFIMPDSAKIYMRKADIARFRVAYKDYLFEKMRKMR